MSYPRLRATLRVAGANSVAPASSSRSPTAEGSIWPLAVAVFTLADERIEESSGLAAPALSPDGRWVAWTDTSDHKAYVAPVSGSTDPTPLHRGGTVSLLTWAADSQRIAVHAGLSDPEIGVTLAYHFHAPAWRSDGR